MMGIDHVQTSQNLAQSDFTDLTSKSQTRSFQEVIRITNLDPALFFFFLFSFPLFGDRLNVQRSQES
jgi:hypothetical protein